jgi:predicted transcriptional regulator
MSAQTAKYVIHTLVDEQPDDASYDEILRALAFERMIERGLKDVREGRVVSDEEVLRRIEAWQK